MTTLVGFVPSIELELEFSGLELLHLFYGATMHYDSRCKATAMTADSAYGRKNGILILAVMSIDEFDWNGEQSHQDFVCNNHDVVANRSLTWREVDLLCKVTEQFNLIATMKVPPQHWDIDVATRIMLGLRRALNEARLNLDILNEQEKLRREKFAEAQKNVLSINAN